MATSEEITRNLAIAEDMRALHGLGPFDFACKLGDLYGCDGVMAMTKAYSCNRYSFNNDSRLRNVPTLANCLNYLPELGCCEGGRKDPRDCIYETSIHRAHWWLADEQIRKLGLPTQGLPPMLHYSQILWTLCESCRRDPAFFTSGGFQRGDGCAGRYDDWLDNIRERAITGTKRSLSLSSEETETPPAFKLPRLEALAVEVTQRLDATDADIDRRFTETDSGLDALAARADRIDGHLSEVNAELEVLAKDQEASWCAHRSSTSALDNHRQEQEVAIQSLQAQIDALRAGPGVLIRLKNALLNGAGLLGGYYALRVVASFAH